MSDTPTSKLGGLFINKPRAKADAAPRAVSQPSGPKDVKRRWLYIGAGLVALVVISTTIFGDKKPITASVSTKAPAMVNTNPPNADKDAFTSKFARDLEAVKVEQERLRQENAAKDKRIADLTRAPGALTPPPGIVPPPIQSTGNAGGLGSLGTAPPAPPEAPVRVAPPVPSRNAASVEVLPPLSMSSSADPLMFEAPAVTPSATAPVATAAKASFKKNASAGMIPAGAFAPIALLNGVDAGTATSTQTNPMPVLMRITDQATLPGAAKYRLKSCFVLASAYGDLSAERVYARVSRLSCVDAADKLILSQEVQGYLVDSDGNLGLRGTITDRQGAKVGKALLAGFAQGLAGALGSAQSTTTTNPATGAVSSALTGDAVTAAGLAGAQSATAQLAQFYLKEAQAIFPVITVHAGRTGTIVFSASTALAWSDGDSQFVQQVQPTK